MYWLFYRFWLMGLIPSLRALCVWFWFSTFTFCVTLLNLFKFFWRAICSFSLLFIFCHALSIKLFQVVVLKLYWYFEHSICQIGMIYSTIKRCICSFVSKNINFLLNTWYLLHVHVNILIHLSGVLIGRAPIRSET